MYRFTIPLVLLTLAACKSTTPPVKTEEISIPKLNIANTVTLGERMLMQVKGFQASSVTVSAAEGYGTSISAGKYCERVPNSHRYYSPNLQAVGLKNGYGKIVGYSNFITYDKRDGEICGATMSCYSSNEISVIYREQDHCLVSNSLQQIIEYNGRNGEILNFTYREFTDGMIRTPFTTNFTLDLSQGKLLTYKGAVIEIISATNSSIEYKLTKNFNSTTN
ncbi:hypothetical protein AN214_03157 [Pseudoalteromonas sp. P1-9]|uniref:hypothetical protein n=1 Tax=Pseudoalteromonas sp. P1-9 TaxID=1710354 RepID=UPI0006D61D81|nr:hypothetical protein [Pseudoalteromonas sp. P1-9]KPV94751.1 hypothetical protein AN214_03157 [Pseudoalteromonas sp. P1-9]